MLYSVEYVRRAVGVSGKLAVRRSAGGADSGLGAGGRSARVRAYGPLRKAYVTGVVAIVLVGVGDGASLAANVAGSIAGVLVFVRSGYGSFVLAVVTYAVAISVVNVVGIVAVLVFTDCADRKLGAGSVSAVASLKVYLFAASVNGADLPMAGSVAYPDSVGTVSAGGNVTVGVAALGADSGISAVRLSAAALTLGKYLSAFAHLPVVSVLGLIFTGMLGFVQMLVAKGAFVPVAIVIGGKLGCRSVSIVIGLAESFVAGSADGSVHTVSRSSVLSYGAVNGFDLFTAGAVQSMGSVVVGHVTLI
jgi:hypothetical protein